MAKYELWLAGDDGTRISLVDVYRTIDYAVPLLDVGVLVVTLPGDFDKSLLTRDRRLIVYRDGRLEDVFLIRRRNSKTDQNRVRTLTVTAYNGNYLLGSPGKATGRIVAYAGNTAQAHMTGRIDDLCKEIVRDNITTDALAARQIAATYLTVEINHSAGPSISQVFAWRNVLGLLQDLAAAAKTLGTPVYWGVAPVSETAWVFQTQIGQPGMDLTYSSTNPNGVKLSIAEGSLDAAELDEDWTDEVTTVYAGGPGEDPARVIRTVSDGTRASSSIFGRREVFLDARSATSLAEIDTLAQQRLAQGRLRHNFTATLAENPSWQYGVNWNVGYRVSAIYDDQQYNGLITAKRIQVSDRGVEAITATLEVDA